MLTNTLSIRTKPGSIPPPKKTNTQANPNNANPPWCIKKSHVVVPFRSLRPNIHRGLGQFMQILQQTLPYTRPPGIYIHPSIFVFQYVGAGRSKNPLVVRTNNKYKSLGRPSGGEEGVDGLH